MFYAMNLHIIYTESAMYLSKKEYSSWRDVQLDFPDFKTSLGPWSDQEVEEYLDDEYRNLKPAAVEQIAILRSAETMLIEVSFGS